MQQQALEIPVTPRYGFTDFIPCSGNATALDFAHRVISVKEPEKLLYIYGPSGSGKTHLLNAVAGSLSREGCRVIKCSDLAGINPELAHKLLSVGKGMILDDLDILPPSPCSRNAVWEAFNRHHSAGHPVVMAGRFHPKEMKNLDDHLVSRLMWGLVASMDISDDNSRKMLIAKLAADRQILLPEEVAAWLVTALPRDLGSLAGACESLYRAALEQKRKISLRLAKELFASHQKPEGVR